MTVRDLRKAFFNNVITPVSTASLYAAMKRNSKNLLYNTFYLLLRKMIAFTSCDSELKEMLSHVDAVAQKYTICAVHVCHSSVEFARQRIHFYYRT